MPELGAIFTGKGRYFYLLFSININAPNKRAIMRNLDKFYTYAYLREDGTPYYIGKGKKNRINEKQGRTITLPPKERRIILKKFNSEFDAYKHEIYMISILGRKDIGNGILRNRSDGGEGASNFSKETKEYFSTLHKGKTLSDETKKKISDANRGRKVSDEIRQKYKVLYSGEGNPNYGKKHSKKTLSKISAKTKNKNLKTRTYINPKNEIIVVNNLREFCTENNLIYNSMISVHTEKIFSHKGYKKYNPKNKKVNKWIGRQHREESKNKMKLSKSKYIYNLKSPDGVEYNILLLNDFCNKNGLNPNYIRYVAIGKWKQYKGWTASRRLKKQDLCTQTYT